MDKEIVVLIEMSEEEFNIVKNYKGPLTYCEYLIKNGTPVDPKSFKKEEGRERKLIDLGTKKIKGFSSAYSTMCDLKLFPNADGTWISIQDNVGTSMTIKLSDIVDFILETYKEESIPYIMHRELDIPLLECQKAYDKAMEYLRKQGKLKG